MALGVMCVSIHSVHISGRSKGMQASTVSGQVYGKVRDVGEIPCSFHSGAISTDPSEHGLLLEDAHTHTTPTLHRVKEKMQLCAALHTQEMVTRGTLVFLSLQHDY